MPFTPPPHHHHKNSNGSFRRVTRTCGGEKVLYSPPFCLSSPVSVTPPSPLNPSASCRSVSLPVSVPIRFHLIHVTSINTQSSPDKSRPLSPPLCLSCVAVHHSLFPQQASFVVTPNVGKRLPAQVSRSTFNTSLLFPRLCFWRALVSAPPPLKMKVS